MNKIHIKYIVKFRLLLCLILVSSSIGCSYVSDFVEGRITKRSSFSITATYDSVADTVTVSWNEPGGGNFAGYEIYISETQDDEFAGYTLVASKHFNDPGSDLVLNGAGSYVDDVSDILLPGTFPNGPGRYFYRLGIIKWDRNLTERTAGNGYIPGYTILTPNAWDTAGNYNIHTEIDEVSGFTQVDIE